MGWHHGSARRWQWFWCRGPSARGPRVLPAELPARRPNGNAVPVASPGHPPAIGRRVRSGPGRRSAPSARRPAARAPVAAEASPVAGRPAPGWVRIRPAIRLRIAAPGAPVAMALRRAHGPPARRPGALWPATRCRPSAVVLPVRSVRSVRSGRGPDRLPPAGAARAHVGLRLAATGSRRLAGPGGE